MPDVQEPILFPVPFSLAPKSRVELERTVGIALFSP